MRTAHRIFALVGLTACVVHQAPPQLAPHIAASPHSVQEVVRIATQTLAAAGFEITVADATGGILTARRTGGREVNADAVTCWWPKGSIGDRSVITTLSINLTAHRDTMTTVQVVGRVRSTLGPIRPEVSATDCASTGSIEDTVLRSLGLRTASRD